MKERKGLNIFFHYLTSFTDLKFAAGADLTESGDAVQEVGGQRLVLLFNKSEGREGEAGMVTVPILMHGGQLVPRAAVGYIYIYIIIFNSVDLSWALTVSSELDLRTYETNRLKKVELVG